MEPLENNDANLENKEVKNSVPHKSGEGYEESSENLGLDADRSSDEQRLDRKYNMDNDMISHNPDGEDDANDSNLERGSSPLMDK
jgi:hypothetical protein